MHVTTQPVLKKVDSILSRFIHGCESALHQKTNPHSTEPQVRVTPYQLPWNILDNRI